jgi:hypothetical protein
MVHGVPMFPQVLSCEMCPLFLRTRRAYGRDDSLIAPVGDPSRTRTKPVNSAEE